MYVLFMAACTVKEVDYVFCITIHFHFHFKWCFDVVKFYFTVISDEFTGATFLSVAYFYLFLKEVIVVGIFHKFGPS